MSYAGSSKKKTNRGNVTNVYGTKTRIIIIIIGTVVIYIDYLVSSSSLYYNAYTVLRPNNEIELAGPSETAEEVIDEPAGNFINVAETTSIESRAAYSRKNRTVTAINRNCSSSYPPANDRTAT